MIVSVFSVPVFFVVFRESLETVVIVSVLLAFIKQSLGNSDKDATLRKKLFQQVRIYNRYFHLIIHNGSMLLCLTSANQLVL